MKKLVFFLWIVLLSIIFLTYGISSEAKPIEDDYEVIPEEAIRLRILAHSNDSLDQAIKYQIRDELNLLISRWVEHLTNIDEARELIEYRLPEINSVVHKILEEQNFQYSATVKYDHQVTFPMKLYDTFIYPPGQYEAILITLGDGKGDNWWCVLFPPLCFLDFSKGSVVTADDLEEDEKTEEETEEKPIRIKFFLFEWLGWT